jgi:GNAT superfamily N-acetyltransferase
MSDHRYALRPPGSEAEWTDYHTLRRTILFERRGRFGVYNAEHPDEHRPEHHPRLFFVDGEAAGTVRIDVGVDEAVFRLVTIREDLQRRGHGTRMLALAERFVREQGVDRVHSHVNADAVRFYERCGFVREGPGESRGTVLMGKDLK